RPVPQPPETAAEETAMARNRGSPVDPPADPATADGLPELQRPPAEVLYAKELAHLAETDADEPRPKGWRLAPKSVVRFVLGDERQGVAAKFVGKRRFVGRCVVELAGGRERQMFDERG